MSVPFENLPPENLEAEQAVLGAILRDNRCLNRGASGLKAEHFSYQPHAMIFQACVDIVGAGDLANHTTLKTKFQNGLGDVGGPEYLARLIVNSATPQSVESYAKVVRDLATRRQIWHLCMHYAEQACADSIGVSADEVTAMLMADTQALCTETGKTQIRRRREVLAEVADGMKAPPPCFSTGLASLDKAMGGGIFIKRAYGLAARKKAGKTALMGTISHALNTAGVPHLYVCGEMSPAEIEHRQIARDLRTNAIRFLRQETPGFVAQTGTYAAKAPDNMFYLEAPGISFPELKRVIALAVAQHGIKGFFLDYLQLVTGKPAGQSMAEFLDEVAQWCANFARRAGIWAVVASQVNQNENIRGGEGLLLAFDQVYRLRRAGSEESPDADAWLETMVSRYAPAVGVGSEERPALTLNPMGPFFEELLV